MYTPLCECTNIIIYSLHIVFAVPPPSVVVTVPEGTHYVGTPLTLTCDITVDSAVDTSVMVEVTWTGSGAMSGNITRGAIADGAYQSTLVFNPLSESDKGELQL